MKKVFNILIICLILILIVLISIIISSNMNSKKEEGELISKVREEIYYLDSNLLLILNDLNNISYENYKVQIENIELSGNSTQNSNKNNEANKASNKETEKNERESEDEVKQSKVISNNILNNSRDDIKWEAIKQTIETVYSSWAVIELDLHAMNIDNETILKFSDSLKLSIMQIKKEDKENSLIALAKTYSILSDLVKKYNTNQIDISLMNTKVNIINAYSIVGLEKWEEAQIFLKEADKNFNLILNDVSTNKNKQAEINKIFVLIKEMQESVTLKDKDIFYINYKNTMQSIENVS